MLPLNILTFTDRTHKNLRSLHLTATGHARVFAPQKVLITVCPKANSVTQCVASGVALDPSQRNRIGLRNSKTHAQAKIVRHCKRSMIPPLSIVPLGACSFPSMSILLEECASLEGVGFQGLPVPKQLGFRSCPLKRVTFVGIRFDYSSGPNRGVQHLSHSQAPRRI
jgi:hypothetical protein